MLVPLASFVVHHGPVGVAARPHPFTSATSLPALDAAVRHEPVDDVARRAALAELHPDGYSHRGGDRDGDSDADPGEMGSSPAQKRPIRDSNPCHRRRLYRSLFAANSKS